MPIGPSGTSASGAISGVTVTGTAAASQVPVASSSSAGSWAYPPGFEISYTQITGNVNVASTTEATGTTIISPGAITFDGTLVLVHLFCFAVQVDTSAAGDAVVLSLFEGATQITRMARADTVITTAGTNYNVNAFYHFTPTAASHTYTITAFATSTTGTPKVIAGSGGTGGSAPSFVRFTKV